MRLTILIRPIHRSSRLVPVAQRASRKSPGLRRKADALGITTDQETRPEAARESLAVRQATRRPPKPSASRSRNSSAWTGPGWTEQDLPARRKSEPEKLAITARLRKETTLSLKPISARVSLGTSKSANTTLHRWMQSNPPAVSRKEPVDI
jgi:hypothetical protein